MILSTFVSYPSLAVELMLFLQTVVLLPFNMLETCWKPKMFWVIETKANGILYEDLC